MVTQVRETKKEKKTAFELFPARTQGRSFLQKKYYFQKQDEYYRRLKEREDELLKRKGLINTNMNDPNADIGFSKQFFENVSNNKLLGITITKESFSQMMNKSQKLPKIDGVLREILLQNRFDWKQRENKKMSNLKKEQETLQRDIKYVEGLESMVRSYS